MAAKRTGISRDLIIHPGETIADILEERNITQAELAVRTGVSTAFVSKVISGQKDISAKFAQALEYALGVSKSFWLNLQANYDAELLGFYEDNSITEEEQVARKSLTEIIRYLRQRGMIPARETTGASILSLRRILQISNLGNLKNLITVGAFRMSVTAKTDPYVLGAWIRLCQLSADDAGISARFEPEMVSALTDTLKEIMLENYSDLPSRLKKTMADYGIDFSVVRNFRGAPVQGYIVRHSSGIYQMVLTIRGAYADIFWFSLFHELGHIVDGDLGKGAKLIDGGGDGQKEERADRFAADQLIDPVAYRRFLETGDFGIESILSFANMQNVLPCVVIGRLQKEKRLDYNLFSNYKIRYKWAESASS